MAKAIGKQVFIHPLVLATIAGFVVAALGVQLPGPVDSLFTFLRSAAAPCALFALGAMLASSPVGRVSFDLPVLIGIKLVVHPLIVYLLLGWIGGFDRVWVYSAVLLAALPPAADVFVARQALQTSYVDRAVAAILFGTIASIATVTIVLIAAPRRLAADRSVPLAGPAATPWRMTARRSGGIRSSRNRPRPRSPWTGRKSGEERAVERVDRGGARDGRRARRARS